MKLCKDCKKIRYDFDSAPLCTDHTSLIDIDPVSGRKDYRGCSIMRKDNYKCFNGALFEKRITLIDAIVLKILKYLR